MNISQNFEEQMSGKTEEELYDILSHKDNYIPQAFDAAEREFSKRNIEQHKVAELQALAKEKKNDEEIRSKESLALPLKIILFLFPLGIFQFLLAAYYRNKGAERKSQECWAWMFYGIVFYTCLLLIRIY